MTLELRSMWHHIELLPADADRTTASGIHLPQVWGGKQDSTALILQSGPGLDLDGCGTIPPMCQPGDLVLIEYGDFHQVEPVRDGHGARGFIFDPRILAWLACDPEDSTWDRPIPLNDWVCIVPDERPTMTGSIHLSEQAERPKSGIIKEVGPGRLIARGDHRGRRLAVEDICGRRVVGSRVYWNDEADVICCGRFKLQWVMIRASDLVAMRWEVPELVMHTRWDMKVVSPTLTTSRGLP